jgi:outer membrane receptor for ferrienterochelin and colicins
LGTNIQINSVLIFRASSGLGYRAPSFKEMFLSFNNSGAGYMVSGNPSLLPEQLIGNNIGFTYIPSPFLRINTNFFRNDLTNLINAELTPSESDLMEFQYQNTNAAYTQGIELDANLNLFYIQLQPKYTFTDAWEKSDPARVLTGRPRHTASVQTILQNNHETMLILTTNWVGTRSYFSDIDGDQELDEVTTNPFTMMNLRVQQTLSTMGINVALGANNLLNAGESQFTVVQPRWFFMKIGGQFPISESNL